MAVGASKDNGNGTESGHVRIYKFTSGVWTHIGNDIDGAAAYDHSGLRLSLSSNGSTLAIGATKNGDNGSTLGEVRIYDLNAILSLDDIVQSKVSIYPNPTKEKFTIQLSEGFLLKKATIYTNLGQLVLISNTNAISTTNLPIGLYYVEIIADKGKTTKKLVIE